MSKRRALINIDYTNDFVADNGALTCGDQGKRSKKKLRTYEVEFIKNRRFVVFAIDVHQEADMLHPETKLFPPHNIEGTSGRRLYGTLHDLYEENQNKITYIGWTKRDTVLLQEPIWRLAASRGITELHLVGVCTDICILHTAVDAYNKGFEVVVHENGVASFDPQGHEWALRHFKILSGLRWYKVEMKLINSNQVKVLMTFMLCIILWASYYCFRSY